MRIKKAILVILSVLMMVSILAAVSAGTKKPDGKKEKPTQVKALPRLLDLGADKCIPCKMMVPVLNDLRKQFKGKLKVDFIDVWKNTDAKTKYKIKIIPTQIFYNSKGKELSRHEGYMPKEDIIAEFKRLGIKL